MRTAGHIIQMSLIFCLVTLTPICWALIGPSPDDRTSVVGEGNEVLRNAFDEILQRRKRASHDQVVKIEFELKQNKSISQLSQTEKDYLLHIHNAYRSTVQPFAANMLELVWDDEIADFAQDWANQCTASHRGNRNLKPWINMGENIFWSYSGFYHEGVAAKAWWDEVRWYNIDTKFCEPGQLCGHYITLVWASSGRIGCGVNRCARLETQKDIGRGCYYFVCNYSGTFVDDTRPYRDHTTICSHCYKTNAPRCRYNLCVTQEMLYKGIGYNGSTEEIGFNRTKTFSSRIFTTKPTVTSTTSQPPKVENTTDGTVSSPTAASTSTEATTQINTATTSAPLTTNITTVTSLVTSLSTPGTAENSTARGPTTGPTDATVKTSSGSSQPVETTTKLTTPETTSNQTTMTPETTTKQTATTPEATSNETATTPDSTSNETATTPEATSNETATTPETTSNQTATTPETTSNQTATIPQTTSNQTTTIPETTSNQASTTPISTLAPTTPLEGHGRHFLLGVFWEMISNSATVLAPAFQHTLFVAVITLVQILNGRHP